MKKLILPLIFLIAINIYAARNEDEQGPVPDRQQRTESNQEEIERREIERLRNRQSQTNQNTNRTSQQSERDDENIESQRENSRAGQRQSSERVNERSQDQNTETQRRSFGTILQEIERNRRVNPSRGRVNNDVTVPWTNNGNRRRQRRITRAQRLKLQLALNQTDILLKKGEGYIDLFVKKNKYIESILLTTVSNTFRQGMPNTREYALRSKVYNEINGDEKLLYKGKYIGKKEKLYFLVSSTVVQHPKLKEAFRIRIPNYVIFGYKWENFGTIKIGEGSKINIRTFRKKYADYSGGHADNIFTIDFRRYSGRDFFSPRLSMYRIGEIEDYIVVYIKYEDNEKYFKNFYIKEGNADFIKLFFSRTDTLRDMRGILILSRYDLINKKLVKFRLYLKKKSAQRKITVIGVDPSGNVCIKPVVITVPAIGQRLDQVMQVYQQRGEQDTSNTGRQTDQGSGQSQRGTSGDEQQSDELPPPPTSNAR